MLIALLVLTGVVSAQEKKDTTKASWEITALVRKGLESKDDKDKPAIFSLTWPSGKDNSYLINAGLGLNFSHVKLGKSRIELSPSFVFNRNNQVKKEQYNMKGVLAGDFQVGKENLITKTHSYFDIYGTLQYMRNKIDTSSSFFTTAYFTWIAKTPGGFLLNNYKSLGKSGFEFYAGPAVGLEYQNRFDVKKPGTAGPVSRLFFGGDFRLAFKDGKGFKKRSLGFKLFELLFNYSGREQLSGHLAQQEGYIYLVKTELNYYPLKSDAVSLGIAYNDGQDPIAAVEKQKFWQFAIKLKLDYPRKN
jgi:hypothetical protein